MPPPLLDVRGLSIRFPLATPVSDFGFRVADGETVALVGESGSGKSLTALAIMGLLPRQARTEGTIDFGGVDLLRLAEKDRRAIRGRKIAMVFQEPMTSLNPVMTVGRQIGEVITRHEGLSRSAAHRRAIELLDLVRVADPHLRVDDYPHRLSGGMRQRVVIAIAVACRPALLVADEPTTALDVTIQAQVLDLLDRLRREMSMALILITHDLGIVGQWADRVVVMYAGRKVEEAAPDALLSRPIHPYSRGLLGASPRLAAGLNYRHNPLKEIPGTIASAIGEPGCPFAPRCELAQAECRRAPPPPVDLGGGRSVACPVAVAAELADAAP